MRTLQRLSILFALPIAGVGMVPSRAQQPPQPVHTGEFAYRAGLAAYQARHYPLSLRHLDEALLLEPTNAPYKVTRGIVRDLNGQTVDAIKDFTAVIDANPTMATGYYYRAGVYARIGRTASAYADAQQALRLAPDDQGVQAREAALRGALATSPHAQSPDNAGGLSKTASVDPVSGAPCGSMTGITEEPFGGARQYVMHFQNICNRTLIIRGERIPNGPQRLGGTTSSTGIGPGSRGKPQSGVLRCMSAEPGSLVTCVGWKRGWVIG